MIRGHVNKQSLKTAFYFFSIVSVFLICSFVLTYNVLFLPSLVIGDSFYWTTPNIVDILGPRVVRESYLGDIAVVSTFKTGFLFPLSYLLSTFKIPITFIYPFLFYFLSMLSFYALSMEFLTKKSLRLIVSAMYVINPITPYYFATMLGAFVIVFLPLTLKFFIRTLREIDEKSNPGHLSNNFLLCAMFLSLSVSANEQFFLSAAFISIYLVLTFLMLCLRTYGQNRLFVRASVINILLFASVFLMVNLALFLSINNINSAPYATYFKGNLNNFLANIRYTYANANPLTLLRLGGDSGVGLGQHSWYDSNTYTNLFGYALFVVFLGSILLLTLRSDETRTDKTFFGMNVVMFVNSILLIEFIKYLPNNFALSELLFNFVLQPWETPAKLRVIVLLSLLTTTLVAFKRLETYGRTRKRRVIKGTVVMLLVVSVVFYNSPWLISYHGYTPLKQISDNLGWGDLFDRQYAELANLVREKYSDERGVMIPYTHKAELYLPPNFRLFQLVSNVNEQTIGLTQGTEVPWSKTLGLFSAKYLILGTVFQPNEILIFPKPYDNNITHVLDDVKDDNGMEFRERLGNYTIYENQEALPSLYATRKYVFYDDTSTLKYAFQLIDFKDLPVFLSSGGQTNKLSIPNFTTSDTYQVNALKRADNSSASSLNLIVTRDGENRETLSLNRRATLNNIDVFSTYSRLSPRDIVEVPGLDAWSDTQQIDELLLNSTSFPLGEYDSFMLNFTVNVLTRGQYSFLAPRVLIDVGNAKKYFIIFHDNGVLELAALEGDSFISGIMARYIGYDLRGESNSINVTISRTFDEVSVYINDSLEMSFSTEANLSTVSLSSENSISKFTGIRVNTRNILRLFAVREVHERPVFSVQKKSSEESVMVVSNGGSDYAVVAQYLYTQLQEIETPAALNEVYANVFFKGWIINATGLNSKETFVKIGIENLQMTIGLITISIVFTCIMAIMAIIPLGKKIFPVLSRQLSRGKRPIGPRDKTKDA